MSKETNLGYQFIGDTADLDNMPSGPVVLAGAGVMARLAIPNSEEGTSRGELEDEEWVPARRVRGFRLELKRLRYVLTPQSATAVELLVTPKLLSGLARRKVAFAVEANIHWALRRQENLVLIAGSPKTRFGEADIEAFAVVNGEVVAVEDRRCDRAEGATYVDTARRVLADIRGEISKVLGNDEEQRRTTPVYVADPLPNAELLAQALNGKYVSSAPLEKIRYERLAQKNVYVRLSPWLTGIGCAAALATTGQDTYTAYQAYDASLDRWFEVQSQPVFRRAGLITEEWLGVLEARAKFLSKHNMERHAEAIQRTVNAFAGINVPLRGEYVAAPGQSRGSESVRPDVVARVEMKAPADDLYVVGKRLVERLSAKSGYEFRISSRGVRDGDALGRVRFELLGVRR